MSNPKMIMLDEPSAGLAPQVLLEIFRNINRKRRDGLTVLLIEQNITLPKLLLCPVSGFFRSNSP